MKHFRWARALWTRRLLWLAPLSLLAWAPGLASSAHAGVTASVTAARDGAAALAPPGAAADVRPAAPSAEPLQEIPVAATARHPSYSAYVPGGAVTPIAFGQPRTLLLILHGISQQGPQMAAPFLPFAQAQNWVVVAPTIAYGDWRDPNVVTGEELWLQPQLANLLDDLTRETGIAVPDRILVFGYSRGAQAALRMPLLSPGRVRAVAALSAGTYTLPVATVTAANGKSLSAPLPYGTANLRQQTGREVDLARLRDVRFWIGVGAKDSSDADVPRPWDPYEGTNRLERARRFSTILAQLGVPVQFAAIPDVGHDLALAMVEPAMAFLADAAALPAPAPAQRPVQPPVAGTAPAPAPPAPAPPAPAPPVPAPAAPASETFAETGVTLSGGFYQQYRRLGGWGVLGPPLVGETYEPDAVTGADKMVVYTPAARLEWYPQTGTFGVGYAGQEYLGDAAAPDPNRGLGAGIARFVAANGGVQRFGYAISDEVPVSDPVLLPRPGAGVVGQWFQTGLLLYYPDRREVVLGRAGLALAARRGLVPVDVLRGS